MNRRPSPPDPLGPIVLWATGVALVIGGWAGASSQHTVAPQMTFVNLGGAGVVLAVTGSIVYLLVLRRSVRRMHAVVTAHPRLAASRRSES